MRKLILAAAVAAGLTLGGPALANPPEGTPDGRPDDTSQPEDAGQPSGDPTCREEQQSGAECAGDNGFDGCQGLNTARDNIPEEAGGHADEGLDLAEAILGAGEDGDCGGEE